MRANLALAKRLKDAQSEVKAIEATLTELEKLSAGARQIAAALQACRGRLGEDVVAPVRSQAALLADEIASSRERFTSTNRRETLPLNNAGRKLERLAKDLGERWQLYAQAQLAPYLELLALVVYLPEVAASEAEINQLVRHIRDQVKEAPQSEAQLAQFDQRLADLGRRLERVASLPDEVRAFLMKVVSSRATLADLTPGVTAWLSEGDRAGAFLITFAPRRS
jgi:hypothetical protein